MIDFLTITCVILALAGAIIAAYSFAAAKNLREQAKLLKEIVNAYTTDLKEWQNKALYKHGQTPLGWENRPKPERSENLSVTPTVVTRSQMSARHAGENQQASPSNVTIHAHGVTANTSQNQSVIEKAQEIINATRG